MPNRTRTTLRGLVVFFSLAPTALAQVTVNGGTANQTVDGFGVSDVFQGSGMQGQLGFSA